MKEVNLPKISDMGGKSLGHLPNHVMCLLSQVTDFLLPVSRAPLHGIRQKVLMFAPTLKSARLSRRIPPKLSLAATTDHKLNEWCHSITFSYMTRICGSTSMTHPQVNTCIRRGSCLDPTLKRKQQWEWKQHFCNSWNVIPAKKKKHL